MAVASEDAVIATINELIAAGKIVEVEEDPRNAFVRQALVAEDREKKWIVEKLTDGQEGAEFCCTHPPHLGTQFGMSWQVAPKCSSVI